MIGSIDVQNKADLQHEANKSLARIWPAVANILVDRLVEQPLKADEIEAFERRLHNYWPDLFAKLYRLYGHHYDFFYHIEELVKSLAQTMIERPYDLRQLDQQRANDYSWYLNERMVGGALYVDLFSENLGKLRQHIDYFRDLGLTYLHLMPLFAVRPGDNDGGYAISNYRSINPDLGTIEDLRHLAEDLRAHGISLVLDFVFNHTADDHHWALQAQAGNEEYQEFYYIFKDRSIPDQYEQHLREIFPTVRRGNFTWHEGLHAWVWTTFNSFQWDLNYSNPAVLRAMLDEMLFLANMGVEILRLDAVAFIWKRLGTNCENQPEAHTLIQIFNHACRIAAPSLVFKSEAIVHPDEVVKYISVQECQLSYNPTLMALLWEALATREIKLLHQSLSHRHTLPSGTAWVNYLRCHDDIGWSFDDNDAAAVGINAFDHRQFLNAFYTGEFPGSFARGVPFQYNPDTKDMRIAGTMASLVGLEQALEENDDYLVEMALRRIQLLYGLICTIGGIPLLYLGEELGVLNDYAFIKDPAKANDSRWIHRTKMDWNYFYDLENGQSIHSRLYRTMQILIGKRKNLPALTGNNMQVFSSGNPHVLGFIRSHQGHRLIVLGNFSEHEQMLEGNRLRMTGLGRFFYDHIGELELITAGEVKLKPYQCCWLEAV